MAVDEGSVDLVNTAGAIGILDLVCNSVSFFTLAASQSGHSRSPAHNFTPDLACLQLEHVLLGIVVTPVRSKQFVVISDFMNE